MLRLLVLSIAFCTTQASAQLSGTYTICSSGCDYSSFSAAADDLYFYGVSGPVVFNAASGSYNEQVNIYGISGASASNTITFNGTGAGTYIYYSLSSFSFSGVVNLSYTNYVTFKNMTIEQTGTNYDGGAAVAITGEGNNTIDHCIIKAPSLAVTGYIDGLNGITEQYSSNNSYTNNTITGGLYCLYISDGYSNTSYGQDVVRNNRLTHGYNECIYAQGALQNEYDGNYADSLDNTYAYVAYSSNESGATYHNNIFAGTTNCQYGIWWIYDPNYYTNAYAFKVYNNIIGPGTPGSYNGLVIQAYYYTLGDFEFKHNTLKLDVGGTLSGVLDLENPGSSGLIIKNNIFDNTAGGYALYYPNATSGDSLDGNDLITTSGSALASYNNIEYKTFAEYKKIALTNGQGTYDQNLPVVYKSTKDLHLNNGFAAPYGPYAGIVTDIDGKTRCNLFPTSGASESGYRRSKPTAKFFGPSTIYQDAPTTFFNAAKAGRPEKYRWYVNGTYITDSLHLKTSLAKSPSVTVSLVVTNCAGSDSTAQTFSVGFPSAPPSTYFIADKNVIKIGDVVSFTDLSTNGASAWQWNITPDSIFDQGVKVPASKYIFGSSTAQNPQIKFLASGKYKVCLTASNTLSGGKTGTGNILCKTAYIDVIASINLGSTTLTKEPRGYLYDDGGPNNDYYPVNSWPNSTIQGITIDACADSVYLIFNSYSTECGYDYVKVYDGKDNTGTLLNKCSGAASGTGYSSLGPGYTGGGSSGCPLSCLPNSRGGTDTLKAGKQMYVEMDMDPYGTYPGFAAYWWTKPRTEAKPSAKFVTSASEHHDSICAGGVITFSNLTTGDDLSYAWDLDGDFSDGFETTTKDASWLWLFPATQAVTLVATNCGGPDSFTKIINVFAPSAPVASFKVDNTEPTINDLVFINATVKECVDDYRWTVTNANSSDTGQAQFTLGTGATSANPVLLFTDTGRYTVKLYIDNGGGAQKDSVTEVAYIHVKEGYCIPSVAMVNPALGISQLIFNGINNKTSQGVSDYSNYVNDHSLSTKVELGVTYPISIRRDTPFYDAETRTLYIDWNRNNSFNDPGEKVAIDSNDAVSAVWTTKITVPVSASTGATVMRIAVNNGNYTNTPCGQNEFGEYEDYRLYVTPDQTPPLIYLKAPDTLTIEQGYPYAEPGDSAWDNLNGNITSNIKVTVDQPVNFSFTGPLLVPGKYRLSYNVSDGTGNAAITKYRYVKVLEDTMRPSLLVTGPDTTIVAVDRSSTAFVTLPSVSRSEDLVDGSLPDTITPLHVPVNKLDTVKVMYSTTDLSGNRAIVYRWVIVVDTVAPTLSLAGNATETVEAGASYTDAGVNVSDNYYTAAVLKPLVKTVRGYNLNKIGSYTVSYSLTDPSENKARDIFRTVNVVDTVRPSIVLNGMQSDTVEVFHIYSDPGIDASDNYYSAVAVSRAGSFYSRFTDGKAARLGTYTIIYTARDSSGNSVSATRYITVVDKTAPVVKLLGEEVVTVCRWADYKDSGYSVKDNYYTTVRMDTTGTFVSKGHTNLEGLYTIIYQATDSSGNVGFSATRYVDVLQADDPLCKSGIRQGMALDKYISVYPNPTSGLLTILADLPGGENVSITVYNELGQQVSAAVSANMATNTFTVDLSGHAAGMYMLNVATSHDKITKRIMLNR